MATKKNSVSRRPTTATELSSLTELHIRLNSEVAELRKQLQLVSNYSSAAVPTTTATPATQLKSGAETAAEQKQSVSGSDSGDGAVLSSTFDFTAAYCTTHLPAAVLDLEAKYGKQSFVSPQLPSIISAADRGIVTDVDGVTLMEVEDGVFLMDMEDDGILEDEYLIEEKTKPPKQSKHMSFSQLPSVSTSFYDFFLMEKMDGMEEMSESTTEEMTASDHTSTSSMAAEQEFPCKLLNQEGKNEGGLGETQPSKKNESTGNPAAEKKKKSKWGFPSGGWIFSAGIVLAAVALAIFAAV